MGLKTKSIEFKNKVFTEADIDEVIAIVKSNYDYKRKDSQYSSSQRLSVTIKLPDGESEDFDEKNLDEIKFIYSRKKIVAIYGRYSDYKKSRTFNFSIYEDRTSVLNNFDIQSSDDAWFYKQKSEIDDFLKRVRNQENFYLKYRLFIEPLARFILAIPLTYLFYQIIVAFAHFIPAPPAREISANEQFWSIYWLVIVAIFVNFMFSQMAFNKLFKKIDSMWPTIEFNFGPDHLNTAKSTRSIFAHIASAVIIPLLLGVALEMVF